MLRRYLLPVLILSLAVSGIWSLSTTPKASALSGSDFHADRIIDDTLFFDSNSMSVSQIQSFLNAKVPSCDTNGTEPYNGTTHGQYGTSKGYPPPYTCLKDYRVTTTSKPSEANLCNGYAAVNQSAAEIIYGVAQSCGVSPKVLLVLLQKEQGLITDNWPWSIEYRSATGYGCPDTAACDSQYYGFFNQVYSAARQYKRYALSPSSFNYEAYQNNFIQYNPDSNCGGSTIFIQNQATADLYNYTPYQPNPGALANVSDSNPGGISNCGAYGNRNFWWYYNNWFGNTQDPFDNSNVRLSSPLTITPAETGDLVQGETYTASFTVKNSAPYPINIGSLFIAVRGPQGQNRDVPGDNNITIPANGTYTFNKTWFTPDPGWHQFSIVMFRQGLGYSYTAPAGLTPSVVRNLWIDVKQNPLVTTSLSISPTQPTIWQPYTATFTVTNKSDKPMDLGYPFIVARGPQGQNRDVPVGDRVTVPANGTYTYSKQWFPADVGNYTFTIATWKPGQDVSTSFPVAASGVTKTVSATVLDNPTLTSSLSINPAAVIAGVPYTASFTITNSGPNPVNLGSTMIVVRGPQGQNRDVPGDSNVTIPANGTYTFNKQWFTPDPGVHQFSIVVYRPDIGFSYSIPGSASSSTVRSLSINVKPNPRITTSLSINPSSPTIWQNYTASFTVRNDSSQPVDIGYPFIIVRGPQGQNRDVPIGDRVTVAANSTYTYSKQWFPGDLGNYTFTIATWKPGQDVSTSALPTDTGVNRTVTATVHN